MYKKWCESKFLCYFFMLFGGLLNYSVELKIKIDNIVGSYFIIF